MWTTIVSGIGSITSLVKTVFGSKQEKDKMEGDFNTAVQQQYRSEFDSSGDSFLGTVINSINRLVRPGFAIYVGWLVFYLPIYNIDLFTEIMIAYQAVPESLWAVAGIIIVFYFGGRMQIKSLAATKSDIKRIKEVKEELKNLKKSKK